MSKPTTHYATISTDNVHDAVILKSKCTALVVSQRQTPIPRAGEVLIEVHSIALNPVDHIQQTNGFHISSYPAVLGFDIAGSIHSVHESVSGITVGDRVIAMAGSWFLNLPEYGAFQKYVVVPAVQVTLIPSDMSFNEACMLPLALYTSWYALLNLDIPRDTVYQATDKKGILILGVGGSVGSIALQIAKSMGFHIYATASENHHSYLQSLGAGPGSVTLFDYKDGEVINKIVKAAKDDNVVVDLAIEAAAGNLKDIVTILNRTKGSTRRAKISAAPFSLSLIWYMLTPSCLSGVLIKFVDANPDQIERSNDFSYFFNNWLTEKLRTRELVPSPELKVLHGGLNAISGGLEELKAGVSGIKLVVEV